MTQALALMLQETNAPNPIAMLAFMLVWLAVAAVFITGMWKTFEKAGQPGWAAIIPFYNIYILTQIAGRPGWWLVLCLIPLVNIVFMVILAIDVAKSFGKSSVWGFFLLFFLGGIGYLMLGFGSARYLGPSATNPQLTGGAA